MPVIEVTQVSNLFLTLFQPLLQIGDNRTQICYQNLILPGKTVTAV